MTRGPKARALIYAATIGVVAAGLILLALDNGFYSTTVYAPHFIRDAFRSSPVANAVRFLLADPGWTASDLVRKFYSVLAFGVLGFLIARALGARLSLSRLVAVAACVAALSAIIEVFQRLNPVHESRLSSALDVLCGAIGGAVGYGLHALTRRRRG
jgi:hypothetical protein